MIKPKSVAVAICAVLVVVGCIEDTPVTSAAPESTVSSSDDTPTSSTSPESTVLDSSDTEPGGPPPLLVVADDARVTVRGFDYCWTDAVSGEGACADWFGSEVPTPAQVDTPTVAVQWVADGALSASTSDDDVCPAQLALNANGAGQWTLAMPPVPGTYRVDFVGESPQGSTRFAILVTSSVEGPPIAPVASVWWPDTSDQFEPYATVVGPGSGISARLQIVSADAVSTAYRMEQLVPTEGGGPAIQCRNTYSIIGENEGPTFVNSEEVIGAAPYEVTFTVGTNGPEFELSRHWPDDLDHEGTLTGSMQPVSGHPWSVERPSDPLIEVND